MKKRFTRFVEQVVLAVVDVHRCLGLSLRVGPGLTFRTGPKGLGWKEADDTRVRTTSWRSSFLTNERGTEHRLNTAATNSSWQDKLRTKLTTEWPLKWSRCCSHRLRCRTTGTEQQNMLRYRSNRLWRRGSETTKTWNVLNFCVTVRQLLNDKSKRGDIFELSSSTDQWRLDFLRTETPF